MLSLLAAVFLLACGSDAVDTNAGAQPDRQTLVVTTSILGDVVENIVLDEFNVVTMRVTAPALSRIVRLR